MSRNLERFRRVTKTEPKPLDEPSTGIPRGYVPIKATLYFNKATRHLVVTADPCEDADPNGVIHNCDANGCLWEHVIARFTVDERQAKEFGLC